MTIKELVSPDEELALRDNVAFDIYWMPKCCHLNLKQPQHFYELLMTMAPHVDNEQAAVRSTLLKLSEVIYSVSNRYQIHPSNIFNSQNYNRKWT